MPRSSKRATSSIANGGIGAMSSGNCKTGVFDERGAVRSTVTMFPSARASVIRATVLLELREVIQTILGEEERLHQFQTGACYIDSGISITFDIPNQGECDAEY